jgi:Cu/Ag efflux pump CusA
MGTLPQPPGSVGLQRIERCWLRLLLIVVMVGPILAVLGVGGTLLGLIAFLVIFAVAAALLIARELRPAVSLFSSAERRYVRRV